MRPCLFVLGHASDGVQRRCGQVIRRMPSEVLRRPWSCSPRLAPRRFARADREHGLGKIAGLGAQAAAAAVSAGKPGRAVELLEQTRGLLLADVFETHSDLAELRATAPGLAEEFERVRDALDSAQDASTDLSLLPMSGSAASPGGDFSNMGGWETHRQETQQHW